MPIDTFTDLKSAILTQADEPTDATSDYDSLIADLVLEVWRGLYQTPWLGLQAYPPQAVLIAAALTGFTITVAAGAIAATLSANPGRNITNWWAIVSGKTYYFRIANGANGANLTLDVAAPETLAAQSVTALAQMEFDLAAGTGILTNALWTDGGGIDGKPVPVIGDENVRYWYPGQPSSGWPPDYAARISTTKIRLSHYDTTAHRIEIPYYQEPADPSGTTTLAIPAFLRPALLEGTLALLFRLKGDSRETTAEARYAAKIKQAQHYDSLLRSGLGGLSGARRFEPYGDHRAPYA